MKLVRVGTCDDEEVGAVARFRQRRHHPAARLQHAEVAVLALAQSVVDNAPAALGNRHDGAHAVDIGSEPAEDRQSTILNQPGGGGDRIGERNVLAIDLRTSAGRVAARSPRPT